MLEFAVTVAIKFAPLSTCPPVAGLKVAGSNVVGETGPRLPAPANVILFRQSIMEVTLPAPARVMGPLSHAFGGGIATCRYRLGPLAPGKNRGLRRVGLTLCGAIPASAPACVSIKETSSIRLAATTRGEPGSVITL